MRGRVHFLGSLAILVGVFSLICTARGAETPFSRIQVIEKTPTVDGYITPGEWPKKHMLRLSEYFRPDHAIHLYFSFDNAFLYLGAYVEDGQLWADGNGGGSGGYWQPWEDDSIEWYFDPNNSRDNFLQDGDRVLALNIGNITDPEYGPGVVSRRAFNKGDGLGGIAMATPGVGVMPNGLRYAVARFGTANNPGDHDTGYSIEVAIPWGALLRGAPADGELMGFNARIISDDTGGMHDWSYNNELSPASLMFTTPVRPDEITELRPGWQHGSQSGLMGPVNYQRLQFHRNEDVTAPDAVGSLSADRTRPYSARLTWACPGDNGAGGLATEFDVRYATSAIDAANFEDADRWPLNLSPRASGHAVQTRVVGLSPGSNYWFGVRAIDEAGNQGPATFTGPVRTPALAEAGVALPEHLYKGAIRQAPGGRYFVREDGANYVPVGYHLFRGDLATRYIYDAPVWLGTQMYNWAQDPGAGSAVTNYFDKLQANGVTVMRLWLEEFFLPVMNNGNFNAANGAFWLEFPRGNFNPKMGDFLVDVLRLCAERGIYVLICPFETYKYDEYLHRTCWSTLNGGPLADINQFFVNSDALAMCKARWQWVINQVKNSGYEDAVFGYELLNEYDSWEWSQASPNYEVDAYYRATFVLNLAQYVKSLDPDRMVMLSPAEWDPHAAKAAVTFYDSLFDVALPHLYLVASRQPWDNPFPFRGAAIMKEHSRAIAWWTLNRLNNRPVMDGEWQPSDERKPNPAVPGYFAGFTEANDNECTRTVWFTELCSGAAGPGLRFPSGFFSANGLLLNDYMLGVLNTVSRFVENGSTDPTFDFSDFPSENWKGHVSVEGTSAAVLSTACSDGTKGLAYLLQDRNISSGTVNGATLRIDSLLTAKARFKAEFWSTAPNQTAPVSIVNGVVSGPSVSFPIPAFSDDWAVRFYCSNGASGEPDSEVTFQVDLGDLKVWWDVLDTASGKYLNVPGSGWTNDLQELVVPGVKAGRWYWIGAYDSIEGRWVVDDWFGRMSP